MSHLELTVRSPSREALVDITSLVQSAIAKSAPTLSGIALVFVPHTTAGVTINEGADPSVQADILATLSRLIPKDWGYRHHEGNSDAHVKTSLIGNQILVPVDQGRLQLGTWQSIFLAEFDGPRTRRVWVTLIESSPPSLIGQQS
ncbi:MAG: secondary thiamine-phosphate synthase enzyme YjbQ [Thermoleophilia bacterium]|nr:secondary thiamine-phosphate synthase enzyme YjbQ [Thermoleophilia bacterium]